MPAVPKFSTRDLIAHLVLEAGRIMEDASVELALILPDDWIQRTDRLDRVERAGDDIAKLAAAALALHRRYNTNPD